MVTVQLREVYTNEDEMFVITTMVEMEHPPVAGMHIINRCWSDLEYDYVTDAFVVERVVYDDGRDGVYIACGKIELGEVVTDMELQEYVIRMLGKNRIGWKLYSTNY